MATLVETPRGISPVGPQDMDEVKVVPPSFHQLAEDWNKYFVEVGDWLVSATEGADSNPPSEGEEEPEAKAGFASAMNDATKAWEALSDYGKILEHKVTVGWSEVTSGSPGNDCLAEAPSLGSHPTNNHLRFQSFVCFLLLITTHFAFSLAGVFSELN
ncbi:uncharacterized protein LOC121866331 [Homarus americanus]|uniref:uncharacterized protein LOC121866331 n=1 Tax=Homarus americanus TaxID=6706 RepID=UPI001C445AD6|nr:uncharacterized protein LOC121866331 [Homarus americanus]